MKSVNGMLKIVCRIVLPGLTIVFLILIPIFSNFEPVQSPLFDFIIRAILVIFFCVNYWSMPNGALFDSRAKSWAPIKEAIGTNLQFMKIYYIFTGLGFSIFVFLITLVAFTKFIPDFSNYRFVASGINGFIFLTSFIIHYPVFKRSLME